MRSMRFAGVESNGLEPWVVVALATALTAHVRYAATPAEQARDGRCWPARPPRTVEALMTGPEGAVDYPVTGMALAALGARVLTTATSDRARDAGVRLLALAVALRLQPEVPGDGVGAAAGVRRRRRAGPARRGDSTSTASRRGRELRGEVLAALAAGGLTSSG